MYLSTDITSFIQEKLETCAVSSQCRMGAHYGVYGFEVVIRRTLVVHSEETKDKTSKANKERRREPRKAG